ncbi:MAG: M20 family metallopeptidase [Victivallaceae bacterium]|nr:M20 family metallopeptidase [Victivallaceae bacterium]
MTIEKIVTAVEAILPEIMAIRHRIHRKPELAGEEFATAELIRETLKDSEIELLSPFLDTDVVGILQGAAGEGGNVTLRADMDALPLSETSGVEYVSEVPNCMHACGHDGHTAMLLGTALVLDKLKSEFSGSVRFVFQPGEEVAALGKELVEAGALLNPEPELVCALHGFNGLPVGAIASKPGAMMAAAGFFTINIKGRGGHGSMPQQAINPLVAGCRIVEALHEIPRSLEDEQTPVVVSVCSINGGSNGNVIPDSAVIKGTVRFLDYEVGARIPPMICQLATEICASIGAKCEVEYSLPYQPTINDSASVEYAHKVTEKYLGEGSWYDLAESSMGGEDFCYYLDKYPGVFCRLGLGNESSGLHNSNFDFNDTSLLNGMIFLVATVLERGQLERVRKGRRPQ